MAGIEGFSKRLRQMDTRCSMEPIHVPGAIQPHGILLATDPASDFRIVARSANAGQLGHPEPLTATLGELLGGEFAAELVRRHAAGMLPPAAPWESSLDLPSDSYDAVAHLHAGLVIVELVPIEPGDAETALVATRRMQRAVAELRGSAQDLDGLARSIVRSVRALTGYERVLVYRFDPDWNGQAIAEDMVEGFPQPLLGLHFPESDIPSQARALYRTSLLRWTLSRDAVAVPLLAAPERTAPVDLSYARLRALSPVHMQYHRNLGVDGAMSVSIMDGEHLWGLVVAHHRQPHRTTAAQRAAALALTDAFALRIRPAEQAAAEAARMAEQERYAQLIGLLAENDDLVEALTGARTTMLDLFDVPGAAIVLPAGVTRLGTAPNEQAVRRLAAWLRAEAPAGDVFASASVPLLLPGWEEVALASGVLAVFLDAARTEVLLWFRPEEPHLVSWGGDPVKSPDVNGILLPRQSFARWVEERRGTARAWAPHEIETARLLRHAMTEVILRNVRRVAALSEQLRQSQKMEAVGQLTGGLAHDFNNLLGGIVSALELAELRIAQGRAGELGRYVAAALGSASRAASLTHRLLAFSRRQTLDPKPVDANKLIASLEELVRRTVGPGIQVETVMAGGLWTVLCDGNQLENALLNLVINARDAMPNGGRMTIEASNLRLDDAVAASFEVPAGHYVGIAVSDTGHGMSPEVAARVFEPFFTTKPLGQGTGLGLSMVYGFARQSGGGVRIYSEPNQGTTMRMFLPRHTGPAAEAPRAAAPRRLLTAGANLVVVDDEPVLRAMVTEALEEAGFVVRDARDAAGALALLREPGPLDLLLTDVGLPGGMNGRQLVEAARDGGRPDLKVLFMTGYAETAALDGGVLGPATQVITKPFNVQALIEKVRVMVEPGC